LTAQIENTNYCNLNCKYCFREETGYNHKKGLRNEIAREKLLKAIEEMSGLGVKAINIVGAGEPLLDKNLEQLLEYISNFGVTPVVATNGSKITPALIEVFQRYGASIIIKMNTFNSELQDELVQKEGYARKRDEGLKLLMNAGFNAPKENYQTRLGINSIVFQDNKHEVLDILRYCRENNIMPIMSTFIPAGRTKDRTDQEVPLTEFLEISRKAQKLDSEEYGIGYKRLLPYLGGVPCTQCGKASIYLTISGDIYDCPGQLNYYGNIKDISISEAFRKHKLENRDFSCPPRLDYWKRTGQIIT
jgi:MoaA/NifB/PqqE/SkfB family radical SAM enzyme